MEMGNRDKYDVHLYIPTVAEHNNLENIVLVRELGVEFTEFFRFSRAKNINLT